MKCFIFLLTVIAVLFTPSASWSWGPDEPSKEASQVITELDSSLSFDPADLLRSKATKSNLYERAHSELQKLNQRPSCHRLATQMHVDDCQLLEQIEGFDAGRGKQNSENRLQDYINSFASTLTVCDLEIARYSVPLSCEVFRESALLQIAGRRGRPALQISSAQISDCMEALAQESTPWTSWNSNRDRATVICQGSRIEIEKDQSIALHQKIAKVIGSLMEDYEDRIQRLHHELADEERLIRELIHGFRAHLSEVHDNVGQHKNIVTDALNDLHRKTTNINQIIGTIMQTVLESNAAQAVTQNQAMEAVITLTHGAQDANTIVQGFRGLVSEIVSEHSQHLKDQQDIFDQKSAQAIKTMEKLTEDILEATFLGSTHREMLQLALEVTSNLTDNIEKANAASRGWLQTALGGVSAAAQKSFMFFLCLLLLFTCSIGMIFLGTYHVKEDSTFTRRMCLCLLGLIVAVMIIAGFYVCMGNRFNGFTSWIPEDLNQSTRGLFPVSLARSAFVSLDTVGPELLKDIGINMLLGEDVGNE